MKAVVLAAGMGARLRPLTDSAPKCLVRVTGKPLLHNALEHLGANGIDTALIVIGHLGEIVRESLGEQFQGIRLTYIENRLFDATNNVYSLWLARDHLNDDILLLEDDIFFEEELIHRLCRHSYANIVVADEYRDFMEGTGINVDHDIVTEFILKENASQVIPHKPGLKTVNIYRFSRQFMETHFVPCLEQVIAEGHHHVFYEFALARIVKSTSVRLVALPAAGLKWFEIDTPEDLRHAEQLFAKQERRPDPSIQYRNRAQQASQAKQDWDLRAAQDAISATAPHHFTRSHSAPLSLSDYFEHGRQQAYTLTCDNFKELALEPAGKRMLEIGCGIGRLFPGFTEMFAEVWGVDVSREMIERAAELHASPNVTLMPNNGYDLAGVPDDHFDLVFSYNALRHVRQRWMAFSYLAETHRVLKVGGAFQLHFRTDRTPLREYVYWHLPHPLRTLAQVLLRLLLLYPLRHLPLRTPHIPGEAASWLGTGFTPTEIESELFRLGFVHVKTWFDRAYPDRTKFWAVGKKP